MADFLQGPETDVKPRRIFVVMTDNELERVLASLETGTLDGALRDEDTVVLSAGSRAKAESTTIHGSDITLSTTDRPAKSGEQAGREQLSRREQEVLHLLAQAKSNGAIANVLGMSERTVRYHLRNIYDKLQLNDRREALVWAVRQSTVDIPRVARSTRSPTSPPTRSASSWGRA